LLRNIRRLRGKAEAAYGKVRITVAMNGTELMEAYEAFLTVEGAGWKGQEGTAIRTDRALIEFYRDLLRSFSTTGDASIYLLWFGDYVVAAKICLRAGRVWSILKIGYDESFREFGPGSMLLKYLLDQACSDPDVDEINLVTSPIWAQRWRPKVRKVFRISVYRNSPLGWLIKVAAKNYRKMERNR